jgi:trk system potassium uptake protein TrkA
MRVIVAGAGRLGVEIANALTLESNEVTLIDNNRPLTERLAGTCNARVVCGDAANPVVLEEAGALKAEVLVATAGEDQVNLVVSLLAKRHFDIPRVAARVNDPENHWLFTDEWGVDVAVSASATLLSLIQEATSVADTVGLITLGRSGVTLIETTLTEGSTAVGKTLAELTMPAGTVIAAVLRAGQPNVPGGSFQLEIGDEILVVSEAATEEDIRRLFQR